MTKQSTNMERIKSLRKKLVLTQTDFAKICGISSSVVSQYEQGTRNPSQRALYSICNSVEVTPDYFDLPSDHPLYNPQRMERKNNMDVRLQTNLLNQIDVLTKKNEELEKGDLTYFPHPEAFGEMAKLLENITKQWNWTFYHSPNPMSCSRNGKVKAINPELEKALGWTEEEMFGSDILDYIHKDDLEKTKKALTQKDRNLTVRIKKKNGNHCLMHVQAKEFGINSKKYSIGLMTCVESGCSDCKHI